MKESAKDEATRQHQEAGRYQRIHFSLKHRFLQESLFYLHHVGMKPAAQRLRSAFRFQLCQKLLDAILFLESGKSIFNVV